MALMRSVGNALFLIKNSASSRLIRIELPAQRQCTHRQTYVNISLVVTAEKSILWSPFLKCYAKMLTDVILLTEPSTQRKRQCSFA